MPVYILTLLNSLDRIVIVAKSANDLKMRLNENLKTISIMSDFRKTR